MALNFIVTDGNLSRVAPSDDGIIGFFALLTDEQAALDSLVGDVVEFFSLKEAKMWLATFETLDNYLNLINTFEQIYSQNPSAHVYFRFILLDDELTDFFPSMNNRIEDIINYSNNTVRILLYSTNKHLKEDIVNDVQSRLQNRFNTSYCGVSAIISAAVNAPIADPITLNAPRVSVVYAKEGEYVLGGMIVGIISKAKVHENCGWVGKFRLNVSESVEYSLSETSQNIAYMTQTQIQSYTSKGYIIPVRLPDYSGWYINDSFTATNPESDFFSIENNRVMDKAVRSVRKGLLPFLNSPVYVDGTGKMRRENVAALESAAAKGLEQMQKDGELSNFDILIDPEQNVLASSQIDVVISIRPVGVARNIVVTIGYTL